MALDTAESAGAEQVPPGVRPMLTVGRGDRVESIHLGALAVCDPAGRLIAYLGDPDLETFLRSTAKPLQALPFLESGAAEAAQDQDVALACASHAGTDMHLTAVDDFQSRVGVSESDLRCGSHRPFDREAAEALIHRSERPTPNRHNCSGKHTAMLATARHLGEPLDSYLNSDHPVQRRIRAAIGEMSGVEMDPARLATDGCSAPNFALPLRATATAFARLADPSALPMERRSALNRIYRSMTTDARYVAGDGCFDTLLMEAAAGRVLAKSGAEGNLGLALRPVDGPPRGIALKVIDGDPTGRAKPLIALRLLEQLDGIEASTAERLAEAVGRDVTSHRGQTVGALEPQFELSWV